MHELEVEFSQAKDFITELGKGTINEHTVKVYDYTEAFLNTLRVLARFQQKNGSSNTF